MTADLPVAVIGGGISGVACARRLTDAGVPAVVYERGRRLGGRMAVRTEQVAGRAHPVDIGASYFTVRNPDFGELVRHWQERGLAAEWTDTFVLATPDGRIGTTTSLMRWSAPCGLGSLVEDLADGVRVRLRRVVRAVTVSEDGLAVDGEPVAAVALAVPDPQAAELVSPQVAIALGVAARSWAPALCLWAAWPQSWWPAVDGVFVDDSTVLSWVADDGSRRGDGAPVLVAHTTTAFAEQCLDDVTAAVEPMLGELPAVVGTGPMPEPEWVRVHRWSLAAPRHPRSQPYGWLPLGVGACGDGWGPRSRVEQAWLSGHLLAGQILVHLGR
jgi:renalase